MPPRFLASRAMQQSRTVRAYMKKCTRHEGKPDIRWAYAVELRRLVLNKRIQAILIRKREVGGLIERAAAAKRCLNNLSPTFEKPSIPTHITGKKAGIVIDI